VGRGTDLNGHGVAVHDQTYRNYRGIFTIEIVNSFNDHQWTIERLEFTSGVLEGYPLGTYPHYRHIPRPIPQQDRSKKSLTEDEE